MSKQKIIPIGPYHPLQEEPEYFKLYCEGENVVDVEWETQFDFRVNSYLSANLGTTLVYDDDINYIDNEGVEHGPRVQFKQLFGFGINFKF